MDVENRHRCRRNPRMVVEQELRRGGTRRRKPVTIVQPLESVKIGAIPTRIPLDLPQEIAGAEYWTASPAIITIICHIQVSLRRSIKPKGLRNLHAKSSGCPPVTVILSAAPLQGIYPGITCPAEVEMPKGENTPVDASIFLGFNS